MITRREFLKMSGGGLLLLSGLLGLQGLARFFSYRPPQDAQRARYELGPASDYPSGTRTVIREARAVVVHDGNGIRALSLICPHLGCVVAEASEGFECPCHGSRFDAAGARSTGPAAQNLRELTVVESDGELYLVRGRGF